MSTLSYPLSASQYGIMLDWIQHRGLTQYNMDYYYTCPAHTDAEKLRNSLQKAINRHDIFFTRVRMEGNEFRQYVDRSEAIVVEYYEMNDASFGCFRDCLIKPFNLLNDVLTRVAVVRTELHVYVIIDISHLLSDALSTTLLWEDICCEYEGRESRVEDIPYARFVEKERRQLQSEAYTQAAAYYRKEFEGLSMTRIPTRNPEAVGSFKGISQNMAKDDVEAFCQAHGITPNILLMTAYTLALSAFSNEQNVVFYSINHGRTDREAKKTLGMFVKTVPFKGDLSDPEKPVLALMRDFKHQMMGNVRHGLYPFTHFCRDLHCLPENSFNFHAVHRNVMLNGEPVQTRQFFSGETLDSISTQIWDLDDYYQLTIDYNDRRYSQWLMEQFAAAFCDIVHHILAKPDARLCDIGSVSEAKARDILHFSQGTPLPPAASHEHHFLDMFSRQVALHPWAVAIVDYQSSITYAELDRRSSLLARQLIQQEHIRPDDTVTIMLPRNKDYMIAVLAVMKTGACYVPVATDYPADRIAFIQSDSQARLHIDKQYIDRFCLEPLPADGVQQPSFPRGSNAYIIYTSGSTGKPKGVTISQRALCSFVRTCLFTYSLSSADKILCHGTFSFDASVEDLFPILACGGELHILREESRTDLKAIHDYIVEHAITGGNYTTAFGELLLTAYPDLPLRYVTLGGERLDKVPGDVSCRFFNSYGPTEFTVDATFWEYPVGADRTYVPIGRPVCDCAALVLDYAQRILPQGCPGELYLTGQQIAEGYWNNPDLTVQKFLPNPYSTCDADRLMFRTGDIVQWDANGQLMFLGRNDTQVKLRGYRIELGEIEAVMVQTESIQKAVVHVITLNGRDVMCAWFVAPHVVSADKLKNQLARRVPHYMIPELFMQVDELPMNANGKVDRRLLPTPQVDAIDKSFVPAATDRERILSTLTAQIIESNQEVSVADDLFDDLGLSSLQAAKLAFMASTHGINVSVTTLYEKRTIRELCADSTERCHSFWVDEAYDSSKPVMVIVCGYVYLHPMYDELVSWFRTRCSLYVIDSFLESFMWKEEITLEKLLDEYMQIYQHDLQGKPIRFFTGLCYGSDIALAFAKRIKQDLGVAEHVLTFDPIYARSAIQETPPIEMNCGATIIEQYRVSNALALTVPLPSYDGPVIHLFAATHTNRKYPEYDDVFLTNEEQEAQDAFVAQNEEQWRTNFPDVPLYHIEGDHFHYMNLANMPHIEAIINKHWYNNPIK